MTFAPIPPPKKLGKTDVNLTITGRVESLRLEPGDKLLVTMDQPLNDEQVGRIREQFRERFPDIEVIFALGMTVQKVEQ